MANKEKNAYRLRFSTAKMMTRHHYFTCANKSKIMADFEADNGVVCESLAQVQGNMEAILELLQTQRAPASANPAGDNVTHAARVTILATVSGASIET